MLIKFYDYGIKTVAAVGLRSKPKGGKNTKIGITGFCFICPRQLRFKHVAWTKILDCFEVHHTNWTITFFVIWPFV